jgi:hypothetical protein
MEPVMIQYVLGVQSDYPSDIEKLIKSYEVPRSEYRRRLSTSKGNARFDLIAAMQVHRHSKEEYWGFLEDDGELLEDLLNKFRISQARRRDIQAKILILFNRIPQSHLEVVRRRAAYLMCASKLAQFDQRY